MGVVDISYLNLLIGLLLMLIPIYFLHHYKTGLVRDTLSALARMVVQLFFLGFYLEYLFAWNSPWVTMLWFVIMVFVASYTILRRVKLSKKILLFPVFSAFFISLFLITGYFLLLVVNSQNLFQVRYFIPIAGIILGNMLTTNIIALNAFFSSIERETSLYHYMLGNGATLKEAKLPFLKQALVKSFTPTIAGMSVMGLISMPGTLIGQILGGSNPNVAIKYQIMIIVVTFSASIISVLLTLFLANRQVFDKYGLLKSEVIQRNS